MKKINSKYFKISFLIGVVLLVTSSCERDPSDDVRPATFSATAEVFIDGFSGGLEYLPFGGSKLDAFTVDDQTFYSGTAAMRFDVPNFGDPGGAFAGAIFPDYGGRDLSGYDALTFWAKATKSATLNEIGFGEDFGENKFVTSIFNLRLTTGWKKYIIPIPDPSVLTKESGMFRYAEGPEGPFVNDENGNLVDLGLDGYTFWVDELKFEKLGTVAQPSPAMFNGANETAQAFIGSNVTLAGLTQTYNLADGSNQTVSAAAGYFTFISSNPSVATVSESGQVNIIGSGVTEITGVLAGVKAAGSLTINSLGAFVPAPVPSIDPSNVLSIFSDAYTTVPTVRFYNGYYAPFQTTLGQDDIEINGDNIIQYTQLNFVGIEFPTINGGEMTHFHVDIQVQEGIDPGDYIDVEVADWGPDGSFEGNDNSSGKVRIQGSELTSGQWASFDIPMSSISGLNNQTNLSQILFISDATISTILVDNMYFYKQ